MPLYDRKLFASYLHWLNFTCVILHSVSRSTLSCGKANDTRARKRIHKLKSTFDSVKKTGSDFSLVCYRFSLYQILVSIRTLRYSKLEAWHAKKAYDARDGKYDLWLVTDYCLRFHFLLVVS